MVLFLHSFLGGWDGMEVGRKMPPFFSLRSKEFKRCPSLSVLPGAEVWAGTWATMPLLGQPRRGLTHRRGDRALICRSVGALLEVIFKNAPPSFFPSFLPISMPNSFISIKPKKIKKQVIDSKRGKMERYTAQPLMTAPNLYTHDPVCLYLSNTHTHTPVSLLN